MTSTCLTNNFECVGIDGQWLDRIGYTIHVLLMCISIKLNVQPKHCQNGHDLSHARSRVCGFTLHNRRWNLLNDRNQVRKHVLAFQLFLSLSPFFLYLLGAHSIFYSLFPVSYVYRWTKYRIK